MGHLFKYGKKKWTYFQNFPIVIKILEFSPLFDNLNWVDLGCYCSDIIGLRWCCFFSPICPSIDLLVISTSFYMWHRKLIETIMGKLRILHGGIMMTSMNIFGLLSFCSVFGWSTGFCCSHLILFLLICCVWRSPACFELGWPMRTDSPFLLKPRKGKRVMLFLSNWSIFCLVLCFGFAVLFCVLKYDQCSIYFYLDSTIWWFKERIDIHRPC